MTKSCTSQEQLLKKVNEQAGTELGQAQPKLKLKLGKDSLIFFASNLLTKLLLASLLTCLLP